MLGFMSDFCYLRFSKQKFWKHALLKLFHGYKNQALFHSILIQRKRPHALPLSHPTLTMSIALILSGTQQTFQERWGQWCKNSVIFHHFTLLLRSKNEPQHKHLNSHSFIMQALGIGRVTQKIWWDIRVGLWTSRLEKAGFPTHI